MNEKTIPRTLGLSSWTTVWPMRRRPRARTVSFWRWRFPIRPLQTLGDLREAPPVEAAGIFPRSLGRHSYVRLTPEQFEAAREALRAARS